MAQVTIYHNPRCSKSRQTLALLEEHNCEIQIIEYLKQPATFGELQQILTLLNKAPRDIMRTKETEYKDLGLNNSDTTEQALIEAMVTTPKLMERPIVLANNKAAIGRPPESVLDII
ncbi:arsenate reductase (glutaredoxin) [Shewanella gelidii]|uniref:Arsenate reductase n=1 Tax=Shewanella gelidii TaxID=1642821 RepID=A0A917NDY2_9GAMM|nr:arsenate reductase (glutaredoxin) [Shewanella gelidii]MCL1099066.1 arsenate reductase (glutaredoxin) [Shewanella gelidii]GGI88435.1 arsenate reductase [Shewanella gelidii]